MENVIQSDKLPALFDGGSSAFCNKANAEPREQNVANRSPADLTRLTFLKKCRVLSRSLPYSRAYK